LRSAAKERSEIEERRLQLEHDREERQRAERAQEQAEQRERDERLAAVLERDITIPAPVVNVDVHVPEQSPPVVNVNVPDDDDSAAKKVSVQRNSQGFITGMTIEEE
jgi:hypothetical protein